MHPFSSQLIFDEKSNQHFLSIWHVSISSSITSLHLPWNMPTTKMSSTEIERIKIYLAKETSSTCVMHKMFDCLTIFASGYQTTRETIRDLIELVQFSLMFHITMQFTSNIYLCLCISDHMQHTKRCTRNFIPNQIEHKIKCYRVVVIICLCLAN